MILEDHVSMNIGDSRIVAWETLPGPTRDMIQRSTESKYDFVLQTPARNEPVRTTLDRALTVFKLFKDSLVLANYVFGSDGVLDKPPHYTHWLDEDRGLPEFRLSQNEEDEFAEFWSEFIDLPPENLLFSDFILPTIARTLVIVLPIMWNHWNIFLFQTRMRGRSVTSFDREAVWYWPRMVALKRERVCT